MLVVIMMEVIAAERVLIKSFAPHVLVLMEAQAMILLFQSGLEINIVMMGQIMLVVIMMEVIAVDHVLLNKSVHHAPVLKQLLVRGKQVTYFRILLQISCLV
jgi:hypothetical protein